MCGLLLIVYVVGMMIWLGVAIALFDDGMFFNEFVKRRKGARMLLATPIWPLFVPFVAMRTILQIWHAAWEESK
jgi:hypothetical protein